MKVILLKDVKHQGKENDIIDVSDGYANNYLFKNKLAVLYTKENKNKLEHNLLKTAAIQQQQIVAFNKIKDELVNKSLEFKVKTGKDDKVFGTISSKQISDKLLTMGYNINKKDIKIINPINVLGTNLVEIKLHPKVKFKIKVNLVK